VGLSTYVTVSQVAQDTLPAQRQVMLEVLLEPHRLEPATTTEIAKATRYPTVTARRYLQELAALRLVDRLSAEGQGHPDRWSASSLLSGLLNDMNRPLTQLGVSVV
jgi:response regulator of citrate/malate metabolism